jgi:hypothetical protein
MEINKEEAELLKSERDILHKQLELLAEISKNCPFDTIAPITEQMVAIYSVLHK